MLEELTAILAAYFKIGGNCYTYYLERDKAAFEIGAMTTDDFREFSPEDVEEIAAHLIAAGVVVQDWIPVTERLPNYGERVFATDGVFTGEMYFATTHHWHRYDGISWENFSDTQITRWMPLPQAAGKDGA